MARRMENEMKKNIENNMETRIMSGDYRNSVMGVPMIGIRLIVG